MLHGGCFGNKGNVRFHSIISRVPLQYDKLAYVFKLKNVELTEEKFSGKNINLCEKDPHFVRNVLKAGQELCLTEEDLGCM